MNAPPKIVVVGGGFGGLNACRELRRAAADVLLLDRRNHHLFQPLLYQVATAALNPSDIAYPIRGIFRRAKNVRVLMGEVADLDLGARQLTLADGAAVPYDYLVIATGATHSYFGHDDWAAHAPGLKTVEDALEVRRRVLLAFEAAEREKDPETVRAWLTFGVVGGGSTGVELAGALAEIGRHSMAKDFRSIDPTSLRVLLVEGRDRVLPQYDEELSAKARKQLERIGVEVVCGQNVSEVDEEGFELGERRIAARTVLWAAGVQASPLGAKLGVEVDRSGRVPVQPDLSVAGHPEVFVVGDLASCRQQDGSPVPGVAPAAIQMGKHAARSIRARLDGRATEPFRYKDKGSLSTIGRAAAVAHVGRWKTSGFTAWLLWWVVHIYFLVGFRSRFLVIFGWAWSYLTFQRGARLITGAPRGGGIAPPEAAARVPPAADDQVTARG